MPHTTIAWFDSLTESVAALGAAARETRFANQAARAALWAVEPGRLQPVHGLLSVPGKYMIRPHDVALGQLHDLCRSHQCGTAALYENMARAYAYGTATALLAVIKGEQPQFVELCRDEAGQYSTPFSLLPDFREALGHWVGIDRLDALRWEVDSRQHAADVADAFAQCEELADYESAALTEARALAAGLADSWCAYGEQAEAALHFLLTSGESQ
ncbi:hypothetical protein QZH56_16045 [Streptomyces olivoreticuli]|uniref:hypothetical protein n=1 Tax=Streptomyces olivoreticuli TaxID=68246 RepID=UPI002658AC34|nr:hypothetical protein [Streptomyces olivoreticuli]WKK26966.1 hypothetical protein QZH56_16045 [Streptomyces olivoreticuli]